MGECQKAFQELKIYLTTAPLLSPSMLGEELYLYLAMTPHAVSSTLIREEGMVQKPIYYTSKTLRGVEGRYPLIEKLAVVKFIQEVYYPDWLANVVMVKKANGK